MKEHNIHLSITNNTATPLVYARDKFDSGRLSDEYSWPARIEPKSTVRVNCYESDWSIGTGCSGWVAYTLDGRPLYFAFSNPSVGLNGIDLGDRESIWNDMTGQYATVSRALPLADGQWLTATILSTNGSTNQASWNLRVCDVETIQPANMELQDVEQVYARFPTTGTRRYYSATSAPTLLDGLVKSHFKGISAFAGKLIFTHTNLGLGSISGKYLVADTKVRGNQGATSGTFHTSQRHPCSSQACGSFMALGMQDDESGEGAKTSEIQLLDIRFTQINQPATLLGSIPRPHDGVNGVAMTKEAGPEGKYIVAGVNGHNLTLYRSRSASLVTNHEPTVEFDEIFHTTTFPDSGAGLALVTQHGDGAIYLFTLDANEGEPSYLNLFRLYPDTTPVTYRQVGTSKKEMHIPGVSESVAMLTQWADMLPFGHVVARLGEKMLNTSFRWGKGLAITSATTLEVYASDRNSFPFSDLEVEFIKSYKDFSVVVWTNDGPVGPLYLTKQGGEGIWTFDVPTGALRQAPGTAGYGFSGIVALGNTLYLTTQGPDGIWAFDLDGSTVRRFGSTSGIGFDGIAAVGTILYCTKQGGEGIWAFDPATDSLQKLPATAGYGFRGVTAVGNTLYLTTQGSDGIWTFDLATNALQQFSSTAGCGFRGLTAVDHTLYLTTQGSDGIWAFDLAAKALRQLPATLGAGFSGVVAAGTKLYLTTQGNDGIWEFDLATESLRQLPLTAGAGFRSLAGVHK